MLEGLEDFTASVIRVSYHAPACLGKKGGEIGIPMVMISFTHKTEPSACRPREEERTTHWRSLRSVDFLSGVFAALSVPPALVGLRASSHSSSASSTYADGTEEHTLTLGYR